MSTVICSKTVYSPSKLIVHHTDIYNHLDIDVLLQATSLPVIDSSQDHFVTAVDDDSLWTPNHTNHATWVTRLVCQLIHSGGVHDELFRLLAPVCKVKVSNKVVVFFFALFSIWGRSIEFSFNVIVRSFIFSFIQNKKFWQFLHSSIIGMAHFSNMCTLAQF